MALNIFLRWTEEDLLARERELSEAISRTHSQVNSEGTDATGESIVNMERMIGQIREALYVIDPETYPLTDAVRITRTKAILSGGGAYGYAEESE